MEKNTQATNFDLATKFREREVFDDVETLKLTSAVDNAIENSKLEGVQMDTFKLELKKIVDEAIEVGLDENKLTDLADAIEEAAGSRDNIRKLREYLESRDELNLAGLIRASQETSAEQAGEVELAVTLHSGDMSTLTASQEKIIKEASTKTVVKDNTISEFAKTVEKNFGVNVKEIIKATGTNDSALLLENIRDEITKSTELDSKQNDTLEKALSNLDKSIKLLDKSDVKTMSEKIKESNTQGLLMNGLKSISEKLDNISTSERILGRFEDATEDEELGSAAAKGLRDMVTKGAQGILAGLTASGALATMTAAVIPTVLGVLAAGGGYALATFLREKILPKIATDFIDDSVESTMNFFDRFSENLDEGITGIRADFGDKEAQKEVDDAKAYDEKMAERMADGYQPMSREERVLRGKVYRDKRKAELSGNGEIVEDFDPLDLSINAEEKELRSELLSNKEDVKDFNPQASTNPNGTATFKKYVAPDAPDETSMGKEYVAPDVDDSVIIHGEQEAEKLIMKKFTEIDKADAEANKNSTTVIDSSTVNNNNQVTNITNQVTESAFI